MLPNYENGILLGILTEKISFVRKLLKHPDKFDDEEIKEMLGVSKAYAAHLLNAAKEDPGDDTETSLWIIENQGLDGKNDDDSKTERLRNSVERENGWLVGRTRRKEYISYFKKDYFDKFGVEIIVEETGGVTVEVNEECAQD